MRRHQQLLNAGPYGAEVPSNRQLQERLDHGREMRKILVGLFITENISSRKLCDIAHYHTLSGGVGMEDLALKPDDNNSNHNAHVKVVLGNEFGNESLLYVDAPMYDKKNAARTTVPIPILRPSEALSEHFVGHHGAMPLGTLWTPLDTAPLVDAPEAWPPAQRGHAVVKRALDEGVHPPRVRKIWLFMDAAGFTKNESFEGLFINDLDTGKRWLIAVIRKAEFCQCGCRGFCTLWPVHDAILSDLQAAADGRWSVVSHLQQPFADGTKDALRAGLSMGIVIAVCEIRADMPGFSAPMGFRASAHKIHPCTVCNVEKHDLGQLHNVTLEGGPAEPFLTDEYRTLVAACSVVVQLNSVADVRAVLHVLEYDHRKKGFLGRRIREVVALSSGETLLPGDRLHPSRLLRDVAQFEAQLAGRTPFTPFRCLFWRLGPVPQNARLLHHSPLMDIPGVGMQTYAIDVLHTWHLGALPRYNARVLWFLLRSPCYGLDLPPWLAAEDLLHLKLLRLRSALWMHYKRMQAADPTWRKKASQVWSLTIKMLGKEANPLLKAKASENRHLLDFCVSCLEVHQAVLEPVVCKYLLASGRAAVRVNEIIKEAPQVMAVVDQQRLLDVYLQHCAMFVRAGGWLVAKHHLFIHCIQRIWYLGNPRFYTCYHDESLNGVVVKIARSCHRLTFMTTVHDKFRWAGQMGLSTHMF